VLVAVVVLGLVMVPVSRLVIASSNSTSNVQFRSEAADLAAQVLETLQYDISHEVSPITVNGVSLSAGSTASSTERVGSHTFLVNAEYNILGSGGSSSVLCPVQSNAGNATVVDAGDIDETEAIVGWGATTESGAIGKGDDVIERSLADPEQPVSSSTTTGSILTTIDLAPSGGTDTTVPVTTVLYYPSGGNPISVTLSTGTSGCSLFSQLGLNPNPSYYSLTETPPSGYLFALNQSPKYDDIQFSNLTTAGQVLSIATQLIGRSSSVQFVLTPRTFSSGAGTVGSLPTTALPITIAQTSAASSTVPISPTGWTNGTTTTTSLFTGNSAILYAGDDTQVTNATAAGVSLSAGTVASIPTYPLQLSDTAANGAAQLASLTVQEFSEETIPNSVDYSTSAVAVNESFTPAAASAGGTSVTAVPVGEYQLSPASNVANQYVTITPAGACYGNSAPITVASCLTSTTATTSLIPETP